MTLAMLDFTFTVIPSISMYKVYLRIGPSQSDALYLFDPRISLSYKYIFHKV